MAISTDIGVWIAVAFTLMAWSFFLIKDSPLFKFAEVTLSATATAQVLVIAWKLINDGAISPVFQGELQYLIPILLGLMLYTRYLPQYRFLQKWTIAVMIGTGLALATRATIPTNIVSQIVATAKLPFTGDALTIFNSIIILVGTISTISYFFLTVEQKESFGKVTKIGRVFIMIMLGAHFGNTIWTRLAWLIDRVQLVLAAFGR